MDKPIRTDIFVEDRAHEVFVEALVRRLSEETGVTVDIQIRSARGGHGRALKELALYQDALAKRIAGMTFPDLLVVAIDANCQRFSAARSAVGDQLHPALREVSAIACPDPHVERWYLADPVSFEQVVGARPPSVEAKCERGMYKSLLSSTVRDAGYMPVLGGIEFAEDLVRAMDLYRAGKSAHGLKAFVDDVRSRLKQHANP